jgi:hypothetical protein
MEDNNKIHLKIKGCRPVKTDSEWLPVAGYCEYDNEPLVSIKAWNFLTS